MQFVAQLNFVEGWIKNRIELIAQRRIKDRKSLLVKLEILEKSMGQIRTSVSRTEEAVENSGKWRAI